MVDAAAIAGSYSDLKLVKSRSVCQVVVEIPIEQAERFIAAFGMPIPGAEKPVALALLKAEPKKPDRPKVPFHQMSRSQQAGLLCTDERFQEWMGVDLVDPEYTAAEVRAACGVESRTQLDSNPAAAAKWDALVSRYRQATGQMAEIR